ncbi:membrane protein required for colicin V production [Moraxella cuniculi DSM 21768]|uniref:Membrane protein required for colicin V production n=1 Tax=Moraxella cuniculi DSM 21768 TaxID=1122245 RepID=A0A1N7FTK6_9GAMM|nr:CvpA family protein [Moraxella cuniculi]OOS05505.1 colicin V production protein [Moraxella cuniculi]SIS03702.1 membrane protein required for colicin V production [Moraxella cuniculi DSM 21768]
MSWIDGVIFLILLLGLWRGFQAGLIKSISTLLAWLIALIAASRLADDYVFLLNVLSDRAIQIAAMFLLIVLMVLAVMSIVASILKRSLKALRMGLIDRMAGGAVGVMIGLLKVLVLLSVIAPVLVRLPAWQNAVLAPSLLPYAPVAKTLIKKAIGNAWQQMDNPYENKG